MSDKEYLEDRKFILDSISQHREDIKELFKNDVDIKLKLQTLIARMGMIMFIGASATSIVTTYIAGKLG